MLTLSRATAPPTDHPASPNRPTLTGRFHPADPRVAAIAGVVVAALMLRQTWPTVTSDAPRWAALAEQQRQVSIFALPLFGLLGAIAGSLIHRVNVGVTANRSRLEMLAHHIVPLSGAATLGIVAGSTPAIFAARTAAIWGNVNLLEMVVFVAVLTGAATVGYGIATRLASKWAALVGTVSAIGFYVVPLVLTELLPGRSFLGLAPSYGSFIVPPGWTDTTISSLTRAMTYVLVTWAACLIVTRTSSRQNALAVVPLMTLALFATGVVLRQPNIVEQVPATACTQVTDRSVCIPADAAAVLPEIAAGMEAVLTSFGPGAIPDDVDLGDYIDPNLNYTADTARWLAAEQTAAAIVGQPECYAQLFSGNPNSAEYEPRAIETGEVIGVLLARSIPDASTSPLMAYTMNSEMFGPVAQQADQLSNDAISTLFSEQRVELAGCTTPISELLA